MTRRRSLRQVLLIGTTVFAVTASALMVGLILLFTSVQRDAAREISSRLSEQRAADEITTSVYGQILASYQQLQAPGGRNRERFDALGQNAYTRLRQYLFQSMSLEARLEVETIKELHQALEVVAHSAFDLIERGESAAAQARVGEMQVLAERLQAEMNRFVLLREQERAQLHEGQGALLQRLLIGITVVGAALIGLTIFLALLVQRRLAQPLAQLAHAAVRLGGGDLVTRIPPQKYEELQTVAGRFNEMADNIQESRSEIEKQNVALSDNLLNLKQAQRELVQQEKLSAIGFMLAGLAHELNNPLAGILGTAECIVEELGKHSDPAARRIADELVSPLILEARRAGDLVRNLLRFSAQSNSPLDAVHLKLAVEISTGLRGFAFAQAGKELSVTIPEALFVAVDAQRLEHSVMNIMTNSLDAMRTGSGTRLDVRAEAIGTEWVELTFEDDGPGFLEPDRIFDAFYTTKPVGSGTGLGLSLVQRFVTEAGGSIAAANAPSGGARLTIRLRRATPSAAQEVPSTLARPDGSSRAAPAAVPAALPRAGGASLQSPGNGHRVLIVDDEPVLREIQRRFLASIGIVPLIASNGAEALAILKRERCDALITDIRMPGDMDGIALYRWIEIHMPELEPRCLFVTGEMAADGDITGLGAHPDRVIGKPFTRADYLARVVAVLAEVSSPA